MKIKLLRESFRILLQYYRINITVSVVLFNMVIIVIIVGLWLCSSSKLFKVGNAECDNFKNQS